MRAPSIAFAALLSAAGVSGATALPIRPAPAATPDALVVPVQMRCDARACFDPRTGAYTRSRCDHRGCRPVGRVVEYLGQAPYGGGYARQRDYGYERPPAYGYGPSHGYGYGYPRGYGYGRPGQYAPPAGMTQQEYEAYRAGSGGG
ncbi:MAG TPA: hypothetical protein VF744_09200 [Beijerinckiaceae bacterium]|jgi:hypothetical protein